jgi:ABC-type Fe3+ transport system permease subunit
MALSNIFREPRRELIEQGIGTLVVLGIVAGWCAVGTVICWVDRYPLSNSTAEFAASMALALPVIALAVAILFLSHALGEWACNRLEAAGIHLRPRQRK